tara:strand:+ start:45 stop:908 length:864 start_codon:yes stop_codon:yes gene_type:complete
MKIGEKLKKYRQDKKIKLTTVAHKLNISHSIISAIEEDDFLKIPGGDPYTIGFIKSYATLLDLNVQEITNQYKSQIDNLTNKEKIELPKPIEIINFTFPLKIFSFFLITSISTIFYFLFIKNDFLNNKYAMTPDIPEEYESQIEKFEVDNAIAELKNFKEKEKIFLQTNPIEKVIDSKEKKYKKTNTQVIASTQNQNSFNINENMITIKVTMPTWFQVRDKENQIVFSKLMLVSDEYNYSLDDKYTVTAGNAGNIIVLIDGKVMGKLGKKGEVLDGIDITKNFFLNY